MPTPWFHDLKTAYLVTDVIVASDLPDETSSVLVRSASGKTFESSLAGGAATLPRLPEGTHSLEAWSSDRLVAEEFFTVREERGDDPVMGFVTSFDSASRPSVLAWLRALRCTVVQIYDWMDSYSEPLSPNEHYEDPLGRPIERSALIELISELKDMGAVAQAYAPVCAADLELATEHSQWRLYRNDGVPESLGDLLQIMDPGSDGWQQHWFERYRRAADELGFDGFHLDTYGYPRNAVNVEGEAVDLEVSYRKFVDALRDAWPNDVLSFNQVNGVPRGFSAPPSPGFRYVEVWPPNDKWRHLEGLLKRSAGVDAPHGDTLALYPPVWKGNREGALRTAVLSEAIAAVFGANTLIWGDDHGALSHPYYVEHEKLLLHEAATVLQWHRFVLRCRDLFRGSVDTSWYELSDENASVTVSWDGTTSPEPVGGALFARVFRSRDHVVVSLLDISGSRDGSWTQGTDVGRCDVAEVSILVDFPERWRADVAELGRAEGRFTPIEYQTTEMREGSGVKFSVPLALGWSVLRMTVAPT